MRLREFDKKRKEKLLRSKLNRNENIKKRTIVLSAGILFIAIICFTFARYASTKSYSLIDAKVGDFAGDVKIMSYMYDDGSGSVSNHDVPPAKDSGYKIDQVTCENGDGTWDNELWGITISNITGKVRCDISFERLLHAREVSTSTSGKNLQDAIDELAAKFN